MSLLEVQINCTEKLSTAVQSTTVQSTAVQSTAVQSTAVQSMVFVFLILAVVLQPRQHRVNCSSLLKEVYKLIMYLFCWFELLVFEIMNFIKGIIMGFKNFEFEA